MNPYLFLTEGYWGQLTIFVHDQNSCDYPTDPSWSELSKQNRIAIAKERQIDLAHLYDEAITSEHFAKVMLRA